MFDRSLLPDALLELVVIADTHSMLPVDPNQVEFPSRLKQADRSRVAVRMAAALGPACVLHLGDLTQEYPETERFHQAVSESKAQLAELGAPTHYVAGNQDLGDKPDPTTPGLPVTAQTLAEYHERMGPSWYSRDVGPIHVIVLNSQILNTPMPQAQEQRGWLERDLAEHPGRRIVLCLHLPPYLFDPEEPHLGHYDTLGQPDRRWLLNLVREHDVELMLCGHVHFEFLDRLGHTWYRTMVSPAFTRPGFSHLFSGPSPPEQGRDDAPKLGFYLLRVLAERIDIHLIRTSGRTELPEPSGKRILTCTPESLDRSPLGVTLVHPLSHVTQVPVAWPSVIRQPVRNDYPALACFEMGVRWLRVPLSDLEDSFQRSRLALLQDRGVRVIATALDEVDDTAFQALKRADGFELQIIDGLPADRHVELLERCAQGPPLSLSAVRPRQPVAGKQHPRTRLGYAPAELDGLDERLASKGLSNLRVLCNVAADQCAWDLVDGLSDHLGTWKGIRAIDLRVGLQSGDDRVNSSRVVEALFAAARLPGCRVFVEPLGDMDRTMDVTHGLIDALCNPRPTLTALRHANTLLYGPHFPSRFVEPRVLHLRGGGRVLVLRQADRVLTLWVVRDARDQGIEDAISEVWPHRRGMSSLRLDRLGEGLVETVGIDRAARSLAAALSYGPVMLSAGS